MSDTLGGLLTIALLVALLAAAYVPYGDYMARVYTSTTHLRVERLVYRLSGVNPDAEQGARSYATSVVGFSLVSIVVLMGIQLGQAALPMDRDLPGVPFWMSFNTAVSFVTNTNWQSYSGESTLGFTAQMAGLAVQNFLSAAVGIAVAVALIRGFVRSRSGSLGNFWVDLTRGTIRILLPISFVAAILLVAGGVVQSFTDTTMQTLAGHSQVLTGGPVASQEAIKELGNNGGGFFNANSAHPFENPNAYTNFLEIFLILVTPGGADPHPRHDARQPPPGRGDPRRDGRPLRPPLVAATWSEVTAHGAAAQAAGAAMEGKETRFGEWASALFAVPTTATSTGAVNASHDSLTPVGGGAALFNMMLGEIVPGGVGAGIYGILVMAVLAVFVAGLMVGRTPGAPRQEDQRQADDLRRPLHADHARPGPRRRRASRSHWTRRADAMGNSGGHGFSEVLYAFTSAANNNGSAFGGITVTSDFFQIALGLAMLIGRFLPIVLVLLLAGSLAEQGTVPATAGTLPTHKPLFVGMLVGVILVDDRPHLLPVARPRTDC